MSKKTKLTLTVNPDLPSRAKAFADRLETSVSALVEDYLERLADGNVPSSSGQVEDADDLDGFSGRIMTAPGGEIEVTERQRAKAAYLDNGWFVVDMEGALSPEATTLRATLRRGGHVIQREIRVPRERIRRLYAASGSTAETSSDMRRQFAEIVARATEESATDFYLSWDGKGTTSLSCRINGSLLFVDEMPSEEATAMMTAVFNMSQATDACYREKVYQTGFVEAEVISLDDRLSGVRFHFNPPIHDGRRLCAFRLLARGRISETLEDLGYHPEQVDDIQDACRVPGGIHVLSGPIGSGKSKALAAILAWQQKEFDGSRLIMTVEDPVEYAIPGVMHLAPEKSSSPEDRDEKFRVTLSRAIESRPDVLMISEIRDRAIAALAFQAASRGIQVWTSIGAMNIVAVVSRLADLQVARQQLGDVSLVRLLATQRTLRTLGSDVRRPLDVEHDTAFQWLETWCRKSATTDLHGRLDVHGAAARCFEASDGDGGSSGGTTVAADVLRLRMDPDGSSAMLRAAVLGDPLEATSILRAIEVEAPDASGTRRARMTMLDHAMGKAFGGEVALSEVVARIGD